VLLGKGESMANFMSGVLKKGEDKKAEDVPDELPSLGEDTAPTAEEPKLDSKPEEPPSELPTLEPEKKPEIIPEIVNNTAKLPEEKEVLEPKEVMPVKGDGFFFNISKMLDKGSADQILYQDLLSNMKESWNIKNESAKTGLTSNEEKNIKANIADILGQLRLMESKWKAHKLVLEEDLKVIAEQESKIREKEKDLKRFLRQYKVYQHVPEEKVLLLRNSIPLTSISELINALRKISQSEFRTHCNSRQNDFAALVYSIDPGLARKLESCSSKEEMLRYLEAFIGAISAK
jgi:hypothetical protein